MSIMCNNPAVPAAITLIVEYASFDIMLHLLSIAIIKMLNITVIAVGKAFDIIFFKKFPWILSLFGSKANKKEGIPIATSDIKLICTGSNGYSELKNKNNTAKTLE